MESLTKAIPSNLSWNIQNTDQILEDVPLDHNYNVWFMSLISAFTVGLTGVLPMFLIPHDFNLKNTGHGSHHLRLMLAFAVGGLLGDVFLHLLPEAWSAIASQPKSTGYIFLGLWVVTGMFTFVFIEVIAGQSEESQKDEKGSGNSNSGNRVTGYLNLLANGIDNFTHGLSVAASFMVSMKFGLLTTFAIIIHEVPHELGDFAILLKAGFSKWDAARAQIATASIGVLGAITALSTSELIGERTSWILPFTAGGFLHISLISTLPELIREENPRESLKQLLFIAIGVAVMAVVNSLGH